MTFSKRDFNKWRYGLVQRSSFPNVEAFIVKQFRFLAPALLLFALNCLAMPSFAECTSIKDIERVNVSVIGDRIAHIKGEQAIAFVLLDPLLSMPDFEDFPYRQEADAKAMRRLVATLKRAGINEVVVWRFKHRRTMGAAVAFANRCAVDGYGEPDSVDKLLAMAKAYNQLSSKGPDHPKAVHWVEEIMRAGPFEPTPLRVNVILAKVRPYLLR